MNLDQGRLSPPLPWCDVGSCYQQAFRRAIYWDLALLQWPQWAVLIGWLRDVYGGLDNGCPLDQGYYSIKSRFRNINVDVKFLPENIGERGAWRIWRLEAGQKKKPTGLRTVSSS